MAMVLDSALAATRALAPGCTDLLGPPLLQLLVRAMHTPWSGSFSGCDRTLLS